jgi:hypothetical protein
MNPASSEPNSSADFATAPEAPGVSCVWGFARRAISPHTAAA